MADKTVSVRLEARVSQYQSQLKAATASTRAFGDGITQAARKNSEGFTTIGLGAAAMGAAMLGAFALATGAAIDFESSFAGVRKTVDATEAEFSELAEGMRDMATEIPVNVNELNRIGEAAGQLGIAKGGILDFTETVAKLGVTTNLAGDEAASTLARIANVTQMPQDSFDRLGSAIVALGNAGASTEAEIADFGLRIAGAGKLAGLSVPDILAIGNAMASVGIESEAGGTAVQKVLLGITQAVATGSEDLATFAQTAGMSATEFAAAWEANPAQAFTTFVEGLGAAGDGAFAVLEKLGMTDQRLIRSFLSIAGAGSQLRDSIDLSSAAWETNSALTEEAGKRFDTTASKIQIAKNQINEAAISFGETMLPAVAAVSGVVGTLVSGLGELPGPLRAIAMGGVAVGGSFLSIAGGALLLLPRLGQAKEAMLAAGHAGGLFSFGLKKVVGAALSPLGVGLGLATVALYAFSAAKEKARAMVAAFTSAIEADSGALGENTRTSVENMLAQEDVIDELRDAGVSARDVTDTILDMARGSSTARAEFEKMVDALSADRAIGMSPAAMRLEKIGEGFLKTIANGRELGRSQTAAADAANVHAAALDELGPAMGETTSFADELSEALDGLAGGQITAEKAAIAWRDSVRSLTDELEDGAPTLQGNTEDADKNRKAILSAVEAAMAHGAAVAEQTGSIEEGAKVVQGHIRSLVDQATAAGLSRSEIKNYLAQLNLTPKEIKTALALLDDEAKREVAAWIRYLGKVPRRVTTILQTRALNEPVPATGDHAGGIVGQGGFHRYHIGGTIGTPLRGDEVPIIAQRGERVLSRAEVSFMSAILGARPSTSFPGGGSAPAPDIRGLRITGVLDTPFGPSDIVGIVEDVVSDGESVRHGLARARGRRRRV